MENITGKVVLTYEGIKKIELELETLKTVKRQEIAERIKTAIAFGDLSENSEYDEAKNEQAFTEGRILTLENMLRTAKVVDDDDITTDAVNIGTIVRVFDIDENEECEYSIVGSAEAEPLSMRISNESPVGQALMGKRVGEEIAVNAPVGVIRLRVLDIKK